MEPYPIINGDVPAMRVVLATEYRRLGNAQVMQLLVKPGLDCTMAYTLPGWVRVAVKAGDIISLFGVGQTADWLAGKSARGMAINGVVQWYYPTADALLAAYDEPPWREYAPYLTGSRAALQKVVG